MQYSKEVIEAITKRASGFFYCEESCEYETLGGEKYFLCKSKNRLYFNNGYLQIKIKKLFLSSLRFDCKKILSFRLEEQYNNKIFECKKL